MDEIGERRQTLQRNLKSNCQHTLNTLSGIFNYMTNFSVCLHSSFFPPPFLNKSAAFSIIEKGVFCLPSETSCLRCQNIKISSVKRLLLQVQFDCVSQHFIFEIYSWRRNAFFCCCFSCSLLSGMILHVNDFKPDSFKFLEITFAILWQPASIAFRNT